MFLLLNQKNKKQIKIITIYRSQAFKLLVKYDELVLSNNIVLIRSGMFLPDRLINFCIVYRTLKL